MDGVPHAREEAEQKRRFYLDFHPLRKLQELIDAIDLAIYSSQKPTL